MSALSLLFALLPAIALVVALLQGAYPGERVLERLRAVRRRPRQPSVRAPRRRWAPRVRRRSGELLASALAGRGPPPLSRSRES